MITEYTNQKDRSIAATAVVCTEVFALFLATGEV